MPRFFVSPEAIGDSAITLCGDDARHISRSLRMRPGEIIVVCDGLGIDYRCEISSVSDDFIQTLILEKKISTSEPGTKITLFASLSKGERMDYTVLKSVEVGVTRIVPFLSSRCIVKADKSSKKTTRLQKISEEAAKQCGRGIIPEISPVINFEEMLRCAAGFDLSILFYENERELSLKKAISGTDFKNIAIIIGPEGGFEPFEVSAARESGILIASLGARILRCETAPVCAISAILYDRNEI